MMLEKKIYKNYKEICGAMDWKVTSGKSKILQLKDLERYCKYHKDGNKFIIDEVYENPKEKIYNRGGARNVTPYLEDLTKKLLSEIYCKGKDGQYTIGISSLLKDCVLVNNNYSYCKQKKDKLSKYLDIDFDMIYDWYDSVDKMVKRNLDASLNKLEKMGLIKFNKTYIISKNRVCNSLYEYEIIKDEFGNDIQRTIKHDDIYEVFVKATDEEMKIITKEEGNAMLEMKCKNMYDIIKSGKIKKYYKLCTKKIREHMDENNFNYYFKAYDIFYNKELIENFMETIDISYSDLNNNDEKNINNGVKDRSIKNAINRHNKAIKEGNNELRQREDYIKIYGMMNDKLIDLQAENIKEKVRKTILDNTEIDNNK